MVSLKSMFFFFLQAEKICKKCEALDSPCRVLKFAVEFITVGSDFNKFEAIKNCSLWFLHLTRNLRRSGQDKSFQLQVHLTFFVRKLNLQSPKSTRVSWY